MSKLHSLLGGVSLLLLSISAYALDGVVLINQSKVLDGGGFPFTITEPGSYKLSGNLTVPGGTNGINITTPSVTLDLNGFSISGPSEAVSSSTLSAGIYATSSCARAGSGVAPAISTRCVPCALVSVRNGIVTGFGNGIFIDCAGSSVQQMLVMNTNTGISTAGTSSPAFSGTGAALITGNVVTNSAIGLLVGSNSNVIGNTFSSNSLIDISALCPVNLVNNIVPDNIQTDTLAGGPPCKGSNDLGWKN
jgi:hypothetical protein